MKKLLFITLLTCFGLTAPASAVMSVEAPGKGPKSEGWKQPSPTLVYEAKSFWTRQTVAKFFYTQELDLQSRVNQDNKAAHTITISLRSAARLKKAFSSQQPKSMLQTADCRSLIPICKAAIGKKSAFFHLKSSSSDFSPFVVEIAFNTDSWVTIAIYAEAKTVAPWMLELVKTCVLQEGWVRQNLGTTASLAALSALGIGFVWTHIPQTEAPTDTPRPPTDPQRNMQTLRDLTALGQRTSHPPALHASSTRRTPAERNGWLLSGPEPLQALRDKSISFVSIDLSSASQAARDVAEKLSQILRIAPISAASTGKCQQRVLYISLADASDTAYQALLRQSRNNIIKNRWIIVIENNRDRSVESDTENTETFEKYQDRIPQDLFPSTITGTNAARALPYITAPFQDGRTSQHRSSFSKTLLTEQLKLTWGTSAPGHIYARIHSPEGCRTVQSLCSDLLKIGYWDTDKDPSTFFPLTERE